MTWCFVLMNKLACYTTIFLLLSGCQSTPTHTVNEPVIPAADFDAIKELKKISIEARDELRLLAKAQQSVNAKILSPEQHEQALLQATYVPPGFEQMVDFRYTGELEKGLEAVSLIAGYTLLPPDGVKPQNGIWVNISLENQPLNEALKEIGLQSGDFVRVEVHPSAKVMRLLYLNG